MGAKKEVKIRRSWGIINPTTRRIESKKQYRRKDSKKIIREEKQND